MKFGVCTSFHNYDVLCQVGYDFIELAGTELVATDKTVIKELAKKMNFTDVFCLGINSYCDERLPIVGDGYNRQKTSEYAKMICEKASMLGVKNLGIGSPAARQLKEGYDLNRADAQMRDFLLTTAAVAAEYEMNVLIESLCTKLCNYLVHTSDAVKLVCELQEQINNIAMVLDFYQMSMMNENITEIAFAMPYVKHLHINSFDTEGRRLYLQDFQTDYIKTAIDSARSCGYNDSISIEAATNNFCQDAINSLRILKASII